MMTVDTIGIYQLINALSVKVEILKHEFATVDNHSYNPDVEDAMEEQNVFG